MPPVTEADSIPSELINGEPPVAGQTLFHLFEKLGIGHSTIEHPPMRTVADSKQFRDGDTPGGYSKNLFLRNRKGRMWLITLHENRQVDLGKLGEQLSSGKLSFASPTRLMKYLGVRPGAVTPLAVVNDVTLAVTAVMDEKLLSFDPIHLHPCLNTQTTTLTTGDLLQFMAFTRHEPLRMDFDHLRGPGK